MTKIYAVYDSKMEAYMQPFFMQTKGAAIRAWSDAVNDPNTQFAKHPSDFTLFEIGEYDENSGDVHNYEAKISLGNAVEFQKAEKLATGEPRLIEMRQ